MRRGEMAVMKEVPFARYYGSVDSTPLFVMLAGGYFCANGKPNVSETNLAEHQARLALDGPIRRLRGRRFRRV